MATTAYSTLLNRVVPYVNRAPSGLIDQMIRQSGEAFFSECEIWREDMASFNTVVDQAAYTLVPGYSNVLIKRVESLTLGDSDYPFCSSLYTVGADGLTLTFDPAPLTVEACVVKAVYVPLSEATEIEASMMERWGRHIAEGAVWRIKEDRGNPGKPNPWYDPEGAARYEERFYRGINTARIELMSARQSVVNLRARLRDWV